MKSSLHDYCLQTGQTELLEQWDKEKNGELSPETVTPMSNRKVWWICEKRHEYPMVIAHRTRGSGCPYCSRKKLLTGFNDLASMEPEVAAQWHPMLNVGLSPDAVAVGSHERVWWQCEKGHEWQAMVYSRTGKLRRGCPHCARERLVVGVNDLATVAPEVAAQWHPSLNGDLTPDKFVAGSCERVWWQCENGHEWNAMIYSRAGKKKSGCPFCFSKHSKKRCEKQMEMLEEAKSKLEVQG